jgi:Tfp pilus assembly protein PilF
LGVAYDKTFQPEKAESEFRHAIDETPDDWMSYNNYGIFLLGRNRFDEAGAQFRRATRLNPENVQGFVGIGEALRQSGKTRAAAIWYRKALRLDPNQPVAKQFVE